VPRPEDPTAASLAGPFKQTCHAIPLRNRVTPLGELIATPERGLVYGNRGCLHDAAGNIRRRHAGKRWIACQLRFRGWRRSPLMAPGQFTELFFLDEATALAAGHRPCSLCRRADYEQLTAVWAELHPAQHGADAIDAQLHSERILLGSGERIVHDAPLDQLPDGAMILHDGAPALVLGPSLFRWSPGGYRERRRRPARGRAMVITPPSLLALLATERTPLVPLVHPSAC
jgi:hypothetical protein